MYRNLFAFFQFYYYVIKRSSKRFDAVMKQDTSFIVMITPVALTFSSIGIAITLSSMELISFAAMYFCYLWIPVIIFHSIFVIQVRNEGYSIQLKIQREKDRIYEEEKRQESILRKQYFEQLIEEQKRLEKERLAKAYEEYLKNKQRDTKTENAMKLLGMQKGFTEKDLKTVYRKLTKKHHPDAGGLHSNFVKLNDAYNHLLTKVS